MVYQFSSTKSTSDLTKAQLMLQDHLASYDTVLDNYNFTVSCGHDILSKSENDSAVSVSREEIKRYVDQAESRKEEWLNLWEHHKTKLEESIKLCEFEQKINQVGPSYFQCQAMFTQHSCQTFCACATSLLAIQKKGREITELFILEIKSHIISHITSTPLKR